MQKAVILDKDDLKQVLSDYFCVPEGNVFQAGQLWVVITGKDVGKEEP